jgi:hypothetical protein
MSHYIQVINGEVAQVWDTPPPGGVGNNGWRNAVEIRPAITQYRQGYTSHRIDLNTDPVQIIWDTFDITVDERKASMTGSANANYNLLATQKQFNPNSVTDAELSTAASTRDAQLAAIAAAATHDALDLIQQ